MRNDGMRPALACLKIVILETVNISASSFAVRARPIRSIRSARYNGSVLFVELHCIYLLGGFTSAATAATAVALYSVQRLKVKRVPRLSTGVRGVHGMFKRTRIDGRPPKNYLQSFLASG
jgi:hypothetical protein